MREKPVYLFTGFLGSGKSTFIQDTLETPEFGEGASTLLLVCESGEVHYDESKFTDKVYIETIEREADLTEARLNGIASKYVFDRVLIEYNGMWMTQTLFENMPRNWIIAQEMTFFDATMFELYNKNMRQLCFNKMQNAELVVFNGFQKGADKMPFHKEVRVANRRSQIVYEFGPHDIEVDDIVDELPFDKKASTIEIADDMYADWYRDINENQDEYNNKTLILKGRVVKGGDMKHGEFGLGRHLMTCCVEDMQFAALMGIYDRIDDFKNGAWVQVKAKVRVEYVDAYGEKGPVLYCKSVEACEPCNPEVATF